MARRYAALILASRLQREIDQLFHEIDHASKTLDGAEWQPAIDVFENADSVCVLVEVPGVAAADLEVLVAGNQLTLRGRKRSPTGRPPHARHHCVESTHGAFERQLRVEAPVNSHQARAELRDGLLTVLLPKLDERRQESRSLAIRED